MARGKGEGSITEIKKPGKPIVYQARFTIGYDENGKQKRDVKYFKKRQDAKDWLTEVKAARDKGDYIEPSKMKLSEWMLIWLNEYKIHSLKLNTYNKYSAIIRLNLNPLIGKYALRDLRNDIIQKAINTLTIQNSYANSTIVHIHSVLRMALEQAVKNKIIAHNPAIYIELPKYEKKTWQGFNNRRTTAFY